VCFGGTEVKDFHTFIEYTKHFARSAAAHNVLLLINLDVDGSDNPKILFSSAQNEVNTLISHTL